MSEKTVIEPTEGQAVRHERSDVDSKGVLTFVAGLAAVLIAVNVLLYFFFFDSLDRERERKKSQYPLAGVIEDKLPPSPRLEGVSIAAPEHDVGRLRPSSARIMTGQEDNVLRNGGTVPDEKGSGRRPIDEVLKELAGKLPVRPGPAADPREEFLREPSVTSSARWPRGGNLPEAKGDQP